MLRLAFIISLWPALLSATALGGQLYRSFFSKAALPKAVVVLRASSFEVSLAAFFVFFLPIVTSLLLASFCALRKKGFPGMLVATFSLNAFSLLYGLLLYGALAGSSSGRAGDACVHDAECPKGYVCGLKVDVLPGARGVCVRPEPR